MFCKSPPAQGNILFILHSYADGNGDTEHLIDIASPEQLNIYPALKNAQPIYLVFCYDKKVKLIESMLNEGGIRDKENTHIIILTDSKLSVEEYMPEEKKEAIRLKTKNHHKTAIDNYLVDHPKLIAQLANVASRYLISTDADLAIPLESYGKYFKNYVKTIKILEHGAATNPKLYLHGNSDEYSMGFRPGKGVLLKEPLQDEKSHLLASISNHAFLSQLLNKNISKKTKPGELNTICKDFCQSTLIVPAYLLNPYFFIYCARLILESTLAAQYKEVVFCVNKNAVDENFLRPSERKEIRALSHRSWTNLFCRRNANDAEAICNYLNNFPSRKTIARIVTGLWLNRTDYDLLWQSAPYIGICSGDKTLEKSIQNKLVPLYELHKGKNEIVHELIKLMPQPWHSLCDSLNYISTNRQMMLYRYDNSECKDTLDSNPVTLENCLSWKTVATDLIQHYNFYNNLPTIFENSLTKDDHTFILETRKLGS